MLRNKSKLVRGFTIIEVVIVLAIVGLILVILFRAVPAAQRNAHNQSIKTDASGLLAGVTEYVNNNDGSMPDAVSGATSTSVDIGATGKNVANVKLSYFDGANVSLTYKLSGTKAAPTLGSVAIVTNAICDTSTAGQATSTGATSRNFVAIYTLEGGAKICQAS